MWELPLPSCRVQGLGVFSFLRKEKDEMTRRPGPKLPIPQFI